MKPLTIKQRFNRLDRMIKQGKMIRQSWNDFTQGEERACLLAAISPEAGEKQTSEACPTSVLPAWFAYLTPSMDDNGTLDAWPAFIKRYAMVVRKASSVLDAAGWRRAEARVKALGVEEAMRHTTDQTVLKVCADVVALHHRVVNGGTVSGKEYAAAWSVAESARSAAESAAWSAAKSAARAAELAAKSAAESAAWSAAWSAARAAESAAWSAAKSAAWSAELAAKSAAKSAAESAVWSAAKSAAWDRLNEGILDALEAEINKAEGKGE
jgi:hypothetical protein